MLIENGIKREFIAELKNEKYKQTMSMELLLKIPELKNLVNQRKYEKEVLGQEL